jgi:thiamine biosynthesis lipoprotein
MTWKPRSFRILMAAAWMTMAACASAPKSPWDRIPESPDVHEKQFLFLGNPIRVRVWQDATDKRKPEALFKTAANELARLAKIVDADKPTSELYKVNETALGAPVKVSEDLGNLLNLSLMLHTRSGGSFDITFAPLQEATEKFGPDAGLRGSDTEYAVHVEKEVRKRVGKEGWSYDAPNRFVRIIKPMAKLVVKGVARGYAIQRVAVKLAALKIKGVAVIGSGVLAAAGSALQDPDLMCVEDPDHLGSCKIHLVPTKPDQVLALATAATLDRPGHVYNPKSGNRTFLNGSAMIAAPDAAWAQGSALAASIMDYDKTQKFFDKGQEPRISAVFVGFDGSDMQSGSLEPYATTAAVTGN